MQRPGAFVLLETRTMKGDEAMSKVRSLISTLLGLLALTALTGCSVPEPVPTHAPTQAPTMRPIATDTPILIPSSTPLSWPTEPLLPATPTSEVSLPLPTPTPIPAPQMRGEWRRITTADGLCTDWPVFIGVWYIGTGTTTVCYTTASFVDEITWITRTVPLGTRVTAVGKFPPGGGEMYATDAGVCGYDGVDWNCQTVTDGYPYQDIRRVAHINEVPVLMLTSAVVYLEQTYNIPEIVGVEDAHPTWLSVAEGGYNSNSEIWAGTNGYGVVVIQPETGGITHHTTGNGLSGNAIRDIEVGATLRPYPERRVWVATDNGVGRWDGERWTAYTTVDGLPSNDVRGVAVGEAGTVWAATADGVAYFDGQSWRAFTHTDGLPEGDINGVIFEVGGVWFSTRGSGLLIFVIPPFTQ
jgi:hypothetical protein